MVLELRADLRPCEEVVDAELGDLVVVLVRITVRVEWREVVGEACGVAWVNVNVRYCWSSRDQTEIIMVA